MKKTKDEMRDEYKRADFVTLERGKFHKEAVKGTSVALLDPAMRLSANPHEVAQVFEVPLAYVMNPANHCRHAVEWSGVRREWFSMPYEDTDQKRFIWGVTAGILRNLYCFLSTEPNQAEPSVES